MPTPSISPFPAGAPLTERGTWLAGQVLQHAKRNWRVWAGAIAFITVFHLLFKVGFNVTESLPNKVFVITKFNRHVERGDYANFSWHGTKHFPRGIEFVKIVRGVPGDVVEFRERAVYINGEFVTRAKQTSLKGEPLELGPTGVIPPGKFFMYATHKDSMDSRYAEAGWIDESAVLGKAYPLF